MITRERLEELMKQGAKVYRTYADVCVCELDLKKCIEIDNGYAWVKGTGCVKQCGYPLENLYETKEEAKFAKEFKNITRIDTLNLPTFEELKKFERFDFEAKDGHRYTIHFISGFNTLAITGIIENKYYGEATKENYLEACKIAKKLFLGGKGND